MALDLSALRGPSEGDESGGGDTVDGKDAGSPPWNLDDERPDVARADLPSHDEPGETPTAAFSAVFGSTPTAPVTRKPDDPSFTELISVPGEPPPTAEPAGFDWSELPPPAAVPEQAVPASPVPEPALPEPTLREPVVPEPALPVRAGPELDPVLSERAEPAVPPPAESERVDHESVLPERPESERAEPEPSQPERVLPESTGAGVFLPDPARPEEPSPRGPLTASAPTQAFDFELFDALQEDEPAPLHATRIFDLSELDSAEPVVPADPAEASRPSGSPDEAALVVSDQPSGLSDHATSAAATGHEPFGVAPSGVEPAGVAPTDGSSTNVAPTGVAPTGVAPIGVEPSGVAPASTAPDVVEPDSDAAWPADQIPLGAEAGDEDATGDAGADDAAWAEDVAGVGDAPARTETPDVAPIFPPVDLQPWRLSTDIDIDPGSDARSDVLAPDSLAPDALLPDVTTPGVTVPDVAEADRDPDAASANDSDGDARGDTNSGSDAAVVGPPTVAFEPDSAWADSPRDPIPPALASSSAMPTDAQTSAGPHEFAGTDESAGADVPAGTDLPAGADLPAAADTAPPADTSAYADTPTQAYTPPHLATGDAATAAPDATARVAASQAPRHETQPATRALPSAAQAGASARRQVTPIDPSQAPAAWATASPSEPPGGGTGGAGGSGSGGGFSSWPRERRRLIVFSVVAGVVVVALLVVLFFFGRSLAGGASSAAGTSAQVVPKAGAGSSTGRSAAPSTPAAPQSAAPQTPAPAAEAATGPVAPGTHPWSDLRGGECLGAFQNQWQQTYAVVDCASAHPAQMVSKGSLTGAAGATYPGDASLQSQTGLTCSAPTVVNFSAAQAYTGVQVSASYPTAEQWASGERSYYCFVSRSDNQTMTTSLAVSG